MLRLASTEANVEANKSLAEYETALRRLIETNDEESGAGRMLGPPTIRTLLAGTLTLTELSNAC